MAETASRLLTLLSLLQARRSWTGSELAERLEVSSRTIRNDIERLRSLGYEVHATAGLPGGYRLGPGGATLPPLVLDTEEAVAVAVGLRSGVNCIIGGMEETSVRALAKLEALLPGPVRRRVHNLNRYTVPLADSRPVPFVDPEVLTQLAGLCDTRECVRFWYEPWAVDEEEVAHEVEPYRLVNRDHRWYLLGWDTAADEWAVFDVNRMRIRVPAGARFTARPLTDDEVATLLAELVPPSSWRCEAVVTVRAPLADVEAVLLPIEGTVEAVGEEGCRVRLGGESMRSIALVLGRLDLPFTVESPAEHADEVRRLGDRLRDGAEAVAV